MPEVSSFHDYELFVIGAGSGGVRAARMAAAAGASVAIAEDYRYGGTCVIRGCVPKKLMSYAAHFKEDFEDAAGFGWQLQEPRFDWTTLMANKDKEIQRLEGIYRRLLADSGVVLFDGRARLLDGQQVEVNDQVIGAKTILIATGAKPVMPSLPGIEHAISSNEIFELKQQPRHIVIYGGGFVAVEFAGIFNGLGSRVTLVYRGEQVLRGFDADIRSTLTAEMAKKGINLKLNTTIASIKKADSGFQVKLSDDELLVCDAVLAATGRDPNTADLGLGAAGVELGEKQAIKVNEYSQSSCASIYAVGDVTNRLALTPVALHEAMAFVDTVYRQRPNAMDHQSVADAVFSQPPVSSVGLSEQGARDKGFVLDIYRSTFRPLKHTLSGRDEQSMMKLVVDRQSDRVLGVHMVGVDAPEIVQGFAVALKAGLSKSQFDQTVGIHPTSAEEFVTMREPVQS